MDDNKLNDILERIIKIIYEVDEYEDEIVVLYGLFQNILLQGKLGCFINCEQTNSFELLIAVFMKNISSSVFDIFKMDENTFVSELKRIKITNPAFADVIDESFSAYIKNKNDFIKKGKVNE